MKNVNENDVILRVKHLKQYFKFGTGEYKYNKAVHDVSFDIHRGEVFGLVGESGCGKTTTGRSIIKLYDITSGDVYFKGVRVSAGTRWNEKEIKFTLIRMRQEIERLKSEMKVEIATLDTEPLSNGKSFDLVELVNVRNGILRSIRVSYNSTYATVLTVKRRAFNIQATNSTVRAKSDQSRTLSFFALIVTPDSSYAKTRYGISVSVESSRKRICQIFVCI